MGSRSLTDKVGFLVTQICLIVIVLLPLHAFLTVWASSNFGHYTLFRLWKEFLILIAASLVVIIFSLKQTVRNQLFKHKLTWLILAYTLVDLTVTIWAYLSHDVSKKALAYGLLDDLRFLGFFIICWVASLTNDLLGKNWQKLILWPAVLVTGFGILEMSILPTNFLAHFGYGPSTIMPIETINHNVHYIRILSTLRGANPLGAYLILPISALVVLIVRWPKKYLAAKLLLLAGSIAVLIGSYSRSAWIGAALACLIILVVLAKDIIIKHKLPFALAGATIIIAGAVSLVALRNNTHFQNIFFHTQTHSAVKSTSDQAHLSALTGALKQIIHHPLGGGAGTSGPASVYNHAKPAQIPENYFLQVGEGSGLIGLALFLAINIYLGYLLLRLKTPLGLTLFASLIGITFVNLLSLAWSDDTLSYIWWGLAGMALASPLTTSSKNGKITRA